MDENRADQLPVCSSLERSVLATVELLKTNMQILPEGNCVIEYSEVLEFR